MGAMSYFRRPQLAGKSLRRPTYCSVRGNVRRHDPDGVSSVPYFPSATGTTLIVKTQTGAAVTATLSSTSFLQILTDLNSYLASAQAVAFDDGGCIGIRSNLLGGAGYISVTGGTGAKILGFDPALQSFAAHAGDLASAPEGRVGQPYNSAFPNPGEDLTTESYVRSLGRIAANTDVLYADLLTQGTRLQNVATVAGARQSVIDLGGSIRVFSGWTPSGPKVLSLSSTKEDLSRFFILVDAKRKVPCQSRVVGVSYSTSGTNALGVQQVFTNAAPITSIANGHVVECSSADFIAQGVQPGHYAQISGAQNLDEWDNNGLNWVVEAVRDSTHLALRPMSSSERTFFVSPGTDEQPVVELSSFISGNQSLGTLTVSNGPWTSGARLTISPPLPNGMSVDIWAASPVSKRAAALSADLDGLAPLATTLVSDEDAAPNGLLSRPLIVANGNVVSVGEFLVRWHSRVHRVPATSLTLGTGTWYIYWNEITGQLDQDSNSPSTYFKVDSRDAGAAQATTKGKILCSATVASNNIAVVSSLSRLLAEDTGPITVGYGAQFLRLSEAIEYVNRWALINTETVTSSGSYPHAEIVLTGDVVSTGFPSITAPFVTIRGATAGIRIVGTTGVPVFSLSGVVGFKLENLLIQGNGAVLINVSLGTPKISLLNVRIPPQSTGSFTGLVNGACSSVKFFDCDLNFTRNAVYTSYAGVDVSFYSTNLAYVYDAAFTTPQLLSSQNNVWASTGRLILHDCTLSGMQSTASTQYPLLFKTTSTMTAIIESCRFLGTGVESLLIDGGSSSVVHISHCDISVGGRVVYCPNEFSSFCYNKVVGSSQNGVAVFSGTVRSNSLTLTGAGSSPTRGGAGTAVVYINEAMANTLHGVSPYRLVPSNSFSVLGPNIDLMSDQAASAQTYFQNHFLSIGGSGTDSSGSMYFDKTPGSPITRLLLGQTLATIELGNYQTNIVANGPLNVGDLLATRVLVGGSAGSGARLGSNGVQGTLQLDNNGVAVPVLTGADLAVLIGGPSSNADTYHTHTLGSSSGGADTTITTAGLTKFASPASNVHAALQNLDTHQHSSADVSTGLALHDGAHDQHNDARYALINVGINGISGLPTRLTEIDVALGQRPLTSIVNPAIAGRVAHRWSGDNGWFATGTYANPINFDLTTAAAGVPMLVKVRAGITPDADTLIDYSILVNNITVMSFVNGAQVSNDNSIALVTVPPVEVLPGLATTTTGGFEFLMVVFASGTVPVQLFMRGNSAGIYVRWALLSFV